MRLLKLLKDIISNFKIYILKNTIYLLLLFFVQQISAQNSIIPIPVSYESSDTYFELGNQVNLNIKFKDNQVKIYSKIFEAFLNKSGITINAKNNKNDNTIIIKKLRNKTLNGHNEGYLLEIKNRTIEISASNSSGIFNGLKSLQQLIKTELPHNNLPLKLKGCKIVDYPRFAWRGLMLDVSRHFLVLQMLKLISIKCFNINLMFSIGILPMIKAGELKLNHFQS